MSTLGSPELYAASISRTLCLYFCDRCDRRSTVACTLASMSVRSFTPSLSAVEGISCPRPTSPLVPRASESYLLSCHISDQTRALSISGCRAHAASTAWLTRRNSSFVGKTGCGWRVGSAGERDVIDTSRRNAAKIILSPLQCLNKRKPRSTQGNRIWIFHTQIAGRTVDSGGIGDPLDAEIRFFECNA